MSSNIDLSDIDDYTPEEFAEIVNKYFDQFDIIYFL
jgi:hypothetical protein